MSSKQMDQHTIYMEEGKYDVKQNELPTLPNHLMCIVAVAMLTFIGLIQYSVILISDE